MQVLATNKRAHFDYTIEDKLTVGIVLFGYEVKSCKLGQGRIADAIIRIEDNDLWIHNMDIPLYTKASQISWYLPKRKRKLLATKQQILRWYTKTQKGNATLLPLDLHIDARNRLKLTLWLGVLNKKFDKKAKIKQKDTDKIVQQELKRIGNS